jgi:hypothetical protein
VRMASGCHERMFSWRVRGRLLDFG